MQRWIIKPDSSDWKDAPEIEPICEALKDGKLVAIPTETVYGLAANATDGEACARIYQAKGRPRFNPLISHLQSAEAAEVHGIFDDRAKRLAKAFWPGPLTLVVPKKLTSPISDLATAGLETVALRVPASPITRYLAEKSGLPLAAPSANLSGRISPTSADEVISDLGPSLAFVVDAGPCEVGVESTIVAIAGPHPLLLRPGGTPREAIEEVLGEPLLAPEAKPDAPMAPGMLTSHYAPSAKVRLNAREVLAGEALLAFGSTPIADAEKATTVLNLSQDGNLREAAANLFAYMRHLDATGVKTICVPTIPNKGLGEAINDRLKRAAAPRPSHQA